MLNRHLGLSYSTSTASIEALRSNILGSTRRSNIASSMSSMNSVEYSIADQRARFAKAQKEGESSMILIYIFDIFLLSI